MDAMQTHDDEYEPVRFSSLSLGERLVLAARIAVQTHLEQDAQQPNRQQAKRVAEILGIGGAGPIGLRVMDDPALAPLTRAQMQNAECRMQNESRIHHSSFIIHHSQSGKRDQHTVDQAEPLRRLIARRAHEQRGAA
jgi:hypothetical protein